MFVNLCVTVGCTAGSMLTVNPSTYTKIYNFFMSKWLTAMKCDFFSLFYDIHIRKFLILLHVGRS
jgi:hypothetical protein